jgi:hypothetical protein
VVSDDDGRDWVEANGSRVRCDAWSDRSRRSGVTSKAAMLFSAVLTPLYPQAVRKSSPYRPLQMPRRVGRQFGRVSEADVRDRANANPKTARRGGLMLLLAVLLIHGIMGADKGCWLFRMCGVFWSPRQRHRALATRSTTHGSLGRGALTRWPRVARFAVGPRRGA